MTVDAFVDGWIVILGIDFIDSTAGQQHLEP